MRIDSQEFVKLQKLWDKKLAASGFEDIEWGMSPDKAFLRGHYVESGRIAKRGQVGGGEEYYILLQRWLMRTTFPTLQAMIVAAMQADGLNPSEIKKLLPFPFPALESKLKMNREAAMAWHHEVLAAEIAANE